MFPHSDPDDATVARTETPVPRHPAIDARFTPGTLVADRYRIVSLLGQGGMGEVYRADDVKLGQRVALKYVPERLSYDATALDRLVHEVRIGRTVSHPNVCRMYDIVETDGHRFIAMEYVDGEDLASLLRRIGRLPGMKAIAIARDICAGLAAAHEKGVIHRDLKPANIMVDGRGTARITDFGLAAIVGDVASSGSTTTDTAGTPAYMAPEQLAGGPLTPRSDIYALGLVLYEMFTGKRVFEARTIDDLRRQHSMTKTRPAALATDIDPAVERLILRCLEEDSALRPSSMHAVMAALPGGDPLQAALAAGETPSPQMVAAAGEVGDITAAGGWLLVAMLVVSMIAAAWLTDRGTIQGYVAGIRSREVLADRARTIIRSLGYEPGRDSAGWYAGDRAYLQWVASHVKARERWKTLSGATLGFEYRDRIGWLTARSAWEPVSRFDPAPVQPGDTSVAIDNEGHLLRFIRVPERGPQQQREVDWTPAFAAAALDSRQFQPAPPTLPPPVGSDRRYAWTSGNVRVEAASFNNRPVFFSVVRPWQAPIVPSPSSLGGVAFAITGFCSVIAAGIIARRNSTRGRVDFRGAKRLFIWLAALFFISHLAVIHHVGEIYNEYQLLVVGFGIAMYNGLAGSLLYAATEPYVRRRWPRMLVGWSRMIAGRVRDPLVGREVLMGLVVGAVIVTISRIALYFAVTRGTAIPPNPFAGRPINVTLSTIAALGFCLPQAVLFTVAGLILMLLFRLVLRSTLGALAGTAIVNALVSTGAGTPLLDFVSGLVAGAILMWLIYRVGALAAGCATFMIFVLRAGPFTLQLGESYAPMSITIFLAIVALASFAFHVALAGKPLFGAIGVEEEATQPVS